MHCDSTCRGLISKLPQVLYWIPLPRLHKKSGQERKFCTRPGNEVKLNPVEVCEAELEMIVSGGRPPVPNSLMLNEDV